jgi:uncharacterized membrane protein YhaH (DUF805 family)
MSTSATVPLSQPLYGATFGQAIARFFTKYATFSGRASRSEYWWFFLFNAIIGLVVYVLILTVGMTGVRIDSATGAVAFGAGYWVITSIAGVWGLATLVPHLAVVWRRLHDTNRSGAFYFLAFIPIVGGIILIVLLASGTDPAGARFDAPA